MKPLVVVKVLSSRVEAEVAAGFLRSAGIPVLLSSETVGEMYGLNVGPMAEVRLLVPAEREEEARQLLSEASPES